MRARGIRLAAELWEEGHEFGYVIERRDQPLAAGAHVVTEDVALTQQLVQESAPRPEDTIGDSDESSLDWTDANDRPATTAIP